MKKYVLPTMYDQHFHNKLKANTNSDHKQIEFVNASMLFEPSRYFLNQEPTVILSLTTFLSSIVEKLQVTMVI